MWPRFGGSGLRRFGGALIRSETAVRICFLGLRTDDRSRMMTVGPVHLLWPKSSQPAGVFLGLHVGPSKKESVRHVETAAPRAGLMWTLHAQEVYFVLHISTVTNSGQQDGTCAKRRTVNSIFSPSFLKRRRKSQSKTDPTKPASSSELAKIYLPTYLNPSK